MQGDIYYGKTIEIENPFKRYGIAKIAGAGLSFLFAAPLLVRVQTVAPALIRNLKGQEAYAFLLLVVSCIAIIWLIWGIRTALVGIKHLGQIVVPPRTPPDFTDYDEVEQALTRKEMPVYTMPSSGPLTIARKYLSDKVPFLTERPRVIVEQNIGFAKTLVAFVFVFGIIAFSKGFIPPEALRDLLSPSDFLSFPVPFFMILLVVGALKVGSVFSLLPGYLPRSDVLETIVAVKGAGDPFQLPAAVEETFLSIRTEGMPNRVARRGFQEQVGGVENTGRFQGKVFIETQPTQVVHPAPSVVNFYLTAGVGVLGWSMFLLMQLPEQVPVDIRTQWWYVAGFAWDVAKGLVLASVGGRLFVQAHLLLGIFRYESLLTFLTIEGSYGRSEIKAGKAMTDSFETSNVVVRSDCHARVYGAKALTEQYTLEGDRHIIGMVVAPEADHAQDLVRKTFSEFEKGGVSVRGIDVSSDAIQGIAKANIVYQQQKRVAGPASSPLKLADGVNHEPFGLVGPTGTRVPGKFDEDPENDTKICPDCAETVKARARKCRFCGFDFEKS